MTKFIFIINHHEIEQIYLISTGNDGVGGYRFHWKPRGITITLNTT